MSKAPKPPAEPRAATPPLQGARLWAQWGITLAILGLGVAAAWGCLLTWRSDMMLTKAQVRPVADDPVRAQADMRAALGARPDLADGWRLLANSESFARPAAARGDALQAVQRDPDDWQNWQALALVDFQLGDVDRARGDFVHAIGLENGFAAHFEMGNFYRLLGDEAGFWREMKAALAMAPTANIEGNLDQILAADRSPNQREFLNCLPSDRPDVMAVVVNILYRRQMFQAAESAWQRLSCRATANDALALAPAFDADWAPSCAGLTYGFVNTLYAAAYQASSARPGLGPAAGEVTEPSATSPELPAGELVAMAFRVWNRAAHNAWVPFPALQAAEVGDANFQPPFQGPAFGWLNRGGPGVDIEPGWPQDASSTLRIRFDGQQADSLGLAHQLVAVSADQSYRLSFESRALSPVSEAGIVLQVRDATGELAESGASLLPVWSENALRFTAGAHDALVDIEFAYDRPNGQVRLRGDIALRNVLLATDDGAHPR